MLHTCVLPVLSPHVAVLNGSDMGPTSKSPNHASGGVKAAAAAPPGRAQAALALPPPKKYWSM